MPESIDALLEAARQEIGHRPGPAELPGYVAAGASIVDIRPVEQRSRDGELPGAVVIDRNVLEWRLPLIGPKTVIVCNEGYASSLAAATLRRLGVDATDLDGGYQAWRALEP